MEWRILVRKSPLTSLLRLILTLLLSLALVPATASPLTDTDKSVRSMVSGIVSYTRWPSLSGQPKLCIFSSSQYIQALSMASEQSALPYTPELVRNAQDALVAKCNGIYFGTETPDQQIELINQYHRQPLLVISEHNPDCTVGSAFCLVIDGGQVRFSVNLDALSRSGVRVHPDVLMLARNKKHE
ncbi:YfiR family protein [Kluyvera ascorbata]|uniref:YfiR family protein n=1 Tax=Kluyvera ascorbata TaxID=51288 RepID=UPI0009DEB84F|nr:YfiR family protein [Kluyvera ascorbata]